MAKKNRYYQRAERDYARADYDWAKMDHDGVHKHMGFKNASGEMIQEAMSEPYNQPQKAFMRNYPSTEYINDNLDDSISGIDRQMDSDVSKVRRHRTRTKY